MCPVRGIKAYRGSRVVAPLILNLGGGRKLGVSIMLRPFYPQERTRDPLSRWLGGAVDVLGNRKSLVSARI